MNNNIDNLDLFFLILTGRVSLVVNRLLARRFKERNLEITPEQFSVLALLWKKNDLSQQDLCLSTNKDKPSITRLIDSLEKVGLVGRISGQDRRVNLIHLTEKGEGLKEVALTVTFDILEQALQGVSEGEVDVCKGGLKKVLSNIA